MKQEDKELLLRDLCARLPYGVVVAELDESGKRTSIGFPLVCIENDFSMYGNLKPYLFPLSSITKEHRKEICEILKDININHPPYGLINPNGCDALLTTVTMQGAALIEFYNKYHYDYNGLIGKSLALDATGLNVY